MSIVKPLHEYPQEPVNPILARFLQNLLAADPETVSTMMLSNQNPFVAQLHNSLTRHGVHVDQRVVLFLGTASDRPAVVALYAYSLFCLSKKGTEQLSFDDVLRAYAKGLPPRDVQAMAWLEQKHVPSGRNLLDMPANWK